MASVLVFREQEGRRWRRMMKNTFVHNVQVILIKSINVALGNTKYV